MAIFNSQADFLNGWVHRLPAGDDIARQLLIQFFPAVSADNSKDAQLLFSNDFLFILILMELVYHIVAFDIMQRSPVSSHIKYMARTLCMDMDFIRLRLSHNHRLAPGFQSLSDLFSRQFAMD